MKRRSGRLVGHCSFGKEFVYVLLLTTTAIIGDVVIAVYPGPWTRGSVDVKWSLYTRVTSAAAAAAGPLTASTIDIRQRRADRPIGPPWIDWCTALCTSVCPCSSVSYSSHELACSVLIIHLLSLLVLCFLFSDLTFSLWWLSYSGTLKAGRF